MSFCLVVEGGAMRGLYGAGVLDVLLENDIHSDGFIGVSAGAIHGCSYIAKQLGRSIRYYCKYSRNKKFMSLYSFITTGDIVGKKFCYEELPTKLDPFDNETFMKSGQDFYTTVTNCRTGEPEYLLCKDLDMEIDKLRASASVPLLSHIVEINGEEYLDGAIADSIPVRKALEMGYDKVVVVLTRPMGYRKSAEKLGKLYKMKYRKYPKLVQAVMDRTDMYNETVEYIEKLEKEGKIVVIRPTVDLHVSRMEKDIEKLRELYDLARNDAEEKLQELQEFLASN